MALVDRMANIMVVIPFISTQMMDAMLSLRPRHAHGIQDLQRTGIVMGIRGGHHDR
jgi:hypothetical protein